jgi:hypothetical protein
MVNKRRRKMSNQVEKSTTCIQVYVPQGERDIVRQAVDAANERIAAKGQPTFSESLWARNVIVREARRVVGVKES